MMESKNTGHKDINGREICLDDIVYCLTKDNGYDYGWIFKFTSDLYPEENGYFIGWDVVGPSCEDCSNLKEIMEEKHPYIKVIGTIKND